MPDNVKGDAMKKLYGAIEAGGTKFVCAVGTGPDDIQEIRYPTTAPEETLKNAIDFFMPYKEQLSALGIGSFGPIDLHKHSPWYGYITSTPKPGWRNTNMVAPLQRSLSVPVVFDTDVNAAASGEGLWGAARGLTDYLYVTIGTGIGGGAVAGGQLVHGMVHPEMGHCIIVPREDDHYTGCCPYHGKNCFEGLASGPAIADRWGVVASQLPEDHPAWDLQSDYIAQALVNYLCILSPQKIILGGGVMEQQHLLNKIHRKVTARLNGYIHHKSLLEHIDQMIVLPALGEQAGILGAIALARSSEV